LALPDPMGHTSALLKNNLGGRLESHWDFYGTLEDAIGSTNIPRGRSIAKRFISTVRRSNIVCMIDVVKASESVLRCNFGFQSRLGTHERFTDMPPSDLTTRWLKYL
jgi:hypothetical protein